MGIQVNEKGTEAAPVTVVDIDLAWGEPLRTSRHIRFFANRPFFFIIRDKKHGKIFFQGFMAKPEASVGWKKKKRWSILAGKKENAKGFKRGKSLSLRLVSTPKRFRVF